MDIGSLIIYKNNQLIAFNKPATLTVQSDKTGDKALIDIAEIYCKSRLSLIHRLDRPASGIVLFAKTKNATRAINAQFQDRNINKKYLAVVKNKPAESSGTLVHFLRKNEKDNRTSAFEKEVAHSKKAELSYKIIGSIENYHLLEIDLITGRHHQIRSQLSAIGSPIKGDVKYGFRRGNKDRSIHLHAWKLEFSHPITKERVELVAELPDESVWKAFGDLK
jgi:23S rRNA pseudouridine1911/1915/1917 synthase